MKTLVLIAVLIAALYVTAALSLYLFQRRLIYYPDAERYSPAEEGLRGVREITLDTPDGARLIAWHSPARDGAPTLLYFHGNAGGLADRADRIRRFASAGLGVFMPSYRGYSGGTGTPSEAALHADALLAYDHLRGLGLEGRQIVPYGESLGSGVAVRLAGQRPVGALILDAPYTSLPDIGKTLYPWMPVHTFMVDRFDSRANIAAVKAPLLILHGTRDRVIPLEFGQALFEAAPEPKVMAVIEGAGHSDIYSFGAFSQMQDFLTRHLGDRKDAAQPAGEDTGR